MKDKIYVLTIVVGTWDDAWKETLAVSHSQAWLQEYENELKIEIDDLLSIQPEYDSDEYYNWYSLDWNGFSYSNLKSYYDFIIEEKKLI